MAASLGQRMPVQVLWRVQKLTLDLASVRYRALLPVVALTDARVSCRMIAKPVAAALESATHLVVVKCFDAADLELVCHAAREGKRVFFDLCDNIFVSGYGSAGTKAPAQVLREMVPSLAGIVVPTSTLADVVRRELPNARAVHVIPDGLEDELMLSRQRALIEGCGATKRSARRVLMQLTAGLRRRLTRGSGERLMLPRKSKVILWFGNHGSPWSTFGLSDILLFSEAMERVAAERDVTLVVVSNSAVRYENEIRPLRVPSVYLKWQPDVLHAALARADVVIAPNSLDEFSVCKSANRTVMALLAGAPVVATPAPALRPLADCVWLDDPYQGLSTYLTDSAVVHRHIERARSTIAREYSSQRIGARWLDALSTEAR